MPRDKYVFEIPVYRVSAETWSADARRRVQSWEDGYLSQLEHEPTEADRVHANTWARWAERRYEWRYNEVIAWVRLLWDGPGAVVKGYAWQVGNATLGGWEPRKRYQRGFIAHPFFGGEPMYKVLEIWFDETFSDEAIYAELRAALLQIVAAKGDFPKRHIDLSAFDASGPYLKWRQLLRIDPADWAA